MYHMPNFDKNRIFNESPTKVLKREYENLRADFSKLNAMRYKTFYESSPLSFILENSSLIFSEPYRGLDFYKSIMENSLIPFPAWEKEIGKVTTYLSEHKDQMSDTQRSEYENLLSIMESKYEQRKNSICLYDAMMEDGQETWDMYDDLYEYARQNIEGIPDSVTELMESEDVNLLDVMNIVLTKPELHPTMMHYLEACYYEDPLLPDEFALNTYTTNVISRMMKDSYFSEKVHSIQNMNLRHFIMGLGGVKTSEIVDDILVEHVFNYDPLYSTTENSVNRIFEDDVYSELFEETNAEQKLSRLLCEKAVLDMNKAFLSMDALYEGIISPSVDSVVEQICVESTTIEKIPQNPSGQLKLLEERCSEIDKELELLQERYFNSDGSASSVVSRSVGKYGQDREMLNKKEHEDEAKKIPLYTPKKRDDLPVNPNTSSEEDDDQDDSDDEDSESDTAVDPDEKEDRKKKSDAKKRKLDKYSSMDIDNKEFDSMEFSFGKSDNKITGDYKGLIRKLKNDDEDLYDFWKKVESFSRKKKKNKEKKWVHIMEYLACARDSADFIPEMGKPEKTKMLNGIKSKIDKYSGTDKVQGYKFDPDKDYTRESYLFESDDEDDDSDDKPRKPQDVPKPEKRPFFQRVQNKALDTNVQFKKTVAKGRRTAQDARNAGKAVAKVPRNISDSIKKTVNDWDELDDNRRKEYIIQPGYRKKYFKALQLAIAHGVAWSINPLLNIVLAIGSKISASKDERMKNELIRELKAEIEVTKEKIEDARGNGDNQEKYKLMRIKEKLDAELTRVTANAKYI